MSPSISDVTPDTIQSQLAVSAVLAVSTDGQSETAINYSPSELVADVDIEPSASYEVQETPVGKGRGLLLQFRIQFNLTFFYSATYSSHFTKC
jgi:hypothetical protein